MLGARGEFNTTRARCASVSHKISRYCRVIIAKGGGRKIVRYLCAIDTTASGLLMHFFHALDFIHYTSVSRCLFFSPAVYLSQETLHSTRWYKPCSRETPCRESSGEAIKITSERLLQLYWPARFKWIQGCQMAIDILKGFGPSGLKKYGSATLRFKIWLLPFLGLRPRALHPG